MEHLALHRLSDPRFMAVDVPMAPPRGERRMVCPVDWSLEELTARHVLETGQRERILAAFDIEQAWRNNNRGSGEPGVTYGPGLLGDIVVRADFSWRPTRAAASQGPDAAVVHVMLDASGADEAYLHWLLEDSCCTFVYLVTPPETAIHLPQEIDQAGTKVQIRRVPWTREPVHGRFDPLATGVWFDVAGPEIALRGALPAPMPASFLKATASKGRTS